MPARKTPARLKMVRGDTRKRPEPLLSPLDPPEPPEWLSETARAEWDRVVALVSQYPTWLHGVDMAMLTAYCVSWSQFVTAARDLEERGPLVPGRSSADKARRGALVKNPSLQIARDAQVQMRACVTALGFSPDSRGRVDVGRVEERHPAERFFT